MALGYGSLCVTMLLVGVYYLHTHLYIFMQEEGTNSQYKTEFEQAVDEAETCLEYRLKSDETTSTPRKLFDQVAKLRPKEYIKVSVCLC